MALGSPQWMYKSGEAYELDQSLKFNDDDSAYLSWTPASAGNRRTWTYSCWLKLGSSAGGSHSFFSVKNTSSQNIDIRVDFLTGQLRFQIDEALSYNLNFSRKFRDNSSWYNFVIAFDTTQSTASNRVKIWANNEQLTAFATTELQPAQNFEGLINTATPHAIGRRELSSSNANFYLDGYMAEVHFIDGTALTPSSFGETGTYGEWKPKEYSGTYGTNGFYLPFKQDYTVEGFSATLYKGTGGNAAAPLHVGGVGFQPDLVWTKCRTDTIPVVVFDAVRGENKQLDTNVNSAEVSRSATAYEFETDGFSVSTVGNGNNTGQNYVAWSWDMGGSNATNNDGSYTSTVRANTAYGQSIVSYDATKVTNATVGHGLNSAPEMIIAKGREEAYNWITYHKDLNGGTNPHTKYVKLNGTDAEASGDYWGNAQPTSSVFTLGADEQINPTNSKGVIAYCFHSVTGYSKFGSYTGNGNASGTSVTTGFEPAFVLVKGLSGDMTHKHWTIRDNTRSPNNDRTKGLHANKNEAEFDASNNAMAFSSTGFQLKGTDPGINENGIEYIYMAFANKREYAYWLDQSGNNNDWTSNNLTESDISVDSPTNNFATLNPLDKYGESNLDRIRFKEGNLYTYVTDTAHNRIPATMGVSSGKFYWEELIHSSSSYFWQDQQAAVVALTGYKNAPNNGDGNQPGRFENNGATYHSSGTLYANDNGGSASWGNSYTKGDIISIALDMDNGKVWFAKNGSWQASGNPATGANPAHSGMLTHADTYTAFAYLSYGDSALVFNFGQDSSFAGLKTAQGNQDGNDIGDFYYTPPTGFLALCTKNLPDVAVTPSEHFNTILYTGDDSADRAITGVGFAPDFVWAKERSNTAHHVLVDSVRGATGGRLSSNRINAEDNGSGVAVGSFDSDGFTTGSSYSFLNGSTPFVAWNWKANGSGSSNTNGSINSTVSANTDAGFSIVSYAATGSNATVGHGLSKVPEMLIIKNRSIQTNWPIYHHKNTSAPETDYIKLDVTAATVDNATFWNDTAPTSSVFTIGTDGDVNQSGSNMIAYCFHSVDGYSKVGSYVANGSTDNTFVYTGFRPAYVMIKNTDSGTDNWWVGDNKRDTYNTVEQIINPNRSAAEYTTGSNFIDFVSNGFKVKDSGGDVGRNNQTYVYLAFAETPFKYSNAR